MRLKGTNIKKNYTKKTIVIVNITFREVSNHFYGFVFFFFCVLCPLNMFYLHSIQKKLNTLTLTNQGFSNHSNIKLIKNTPSC